MNGSTARPHVVIVGGFLTEAWQYRPMRARLLAAGAARVALAPIHLPDWAAVGLAGMGPLLLRGARAVREARRSSPLPVMVVGHSLGGIIARLATCETPLDGRVAAVADDIGCLVTLGTPHAFDPRIPWRHAAVRAVEHLDAYCPGARFAPRTGYLTVCSTMAPAVRRAPTRNAFHLFNRLLRDLVGETPGVAGDGLIGGDRCRLDGAGHVELDDVLHGVVYGPWYGDDRAIERWWPVAVGEWRRALEAREVSRESSSEPVA